ncbi:ribonuclease HII [Ammoniphilus sp. CFH 90114]|uniref:ribonuclease HII n=1 Tax=Ammoniphilus sp. CFH 90114 TaxID=2493665 RepID=UPI00100F17C2|nr:ribonuclease HII [Ammoniphilus sp. CFH 90114]RXT15095.1 ribonuclease HII [Ammoniphilus sp. CFH 90114]
MVDLHSKTIKEIKDILNEDVHPDLLLALAGDTRQGVRQLVSQYQKKMERERLLYEQWDRMSSQEKALREAGYQYIAGVDEVGRGPLAGPVIAAAVILPEEFKLLGLNDSKKIPAALRESYYEVIINHAISYAVAFSSPEEIDQMNIYQATMKVMRSCVTQLPIQPDICLVDGLEVKEFPARQLALVGGDGLSVSIAAASIIAKVTRDRFMKEAAGKYPQYGFDCNAGYGTPDHLAAIAQYGPSPLHRKSFGGVKEWVL